MGHTPARHVTQAEGLEEEMHRTAEGPERGWGGTKATPKSCLNSHPKLGKNMLSQDAGSPPPDGFVLFHSELSLQCLLGRH